MRLDKKDINVFLALWIKSDPELWGELRDIQIKLLLQRIVKEWTFKQMAEHYKVDEKKMRLIFEAILDKIYLALGKEVAMQLHQINKKLDSKNTMTIESDFNQIFLN
jgi:phage-related protein